MHVQSFSHIWHPDGVWFLCGTAKAWFRACRPTCAAGPVSSHRESLFTRETSSRAPTNQPTLAPRGEKRLPRYFIPADGDDPSHPNVFQLPSGLVGTGSVRCGDVERHFPLPGRFHFRFKKKFRDAFGESGQVGWLVVVVYPWVYLHALESESGVAERRVQKDFAACRFVVIYPCT